jgi:sugar phosphate isomerase/epimerase
MKVGIQFFSVRESIVKDPIGTMKKVAGLGYKYWETCEVFNRPDLANNYGLLMPAKEGKKFIDNLGVKIIGTHIGRDQIDDDAYVNANLDYQAEVGCESPGLAGDWYDDTEMVKRRCERYNTVGQMCRSRGMRFHYHSHFWEFQKFGNDYVMDLILKYTDPDLVCYELDTYWAMRGEADPIMLIDRYKDRLIMLHQKDFPIDAKEPISMFAQKFDIHGKLDSKCAGSSNPDSFIEIGTGIMDIQSIINAANKANVKYITLEQDRTKHDELESIKISMENFRKYKGIEWD